MSTHRTNRYGLRGNNSPMIFPPVPMRWRESNAPDDRASEVYDWENVYCPWPKRKHDPIYLVRSVYQRYCIPPPMLAVQHGADDDSYIVPRGSDRLIVIPRYDQHNTTLILHECAHGIAMRYDYDRGARPREAWHGPIFLRVAIDLYVRYGSANRRLLESGAATMGLEVAPSQVCAAPPRNLRDRFRTAFTRRHLRRSNQAAIAAQKWRKSQFYAE